MNDEQKRTRAQLIKRRWTQSDELDNVFRRGNHVVSITERDGFTVVLVDGSAGASGWATEID